MINGKTKLLCLLGSPVEHSFSPLMHNAACERLKLNASYLAFDIERDKIEITLDGLKSLKFLGCNVTSPYKVDVMPYLDVIDPLAQSIGAVNTIVYRNFKLHGYNTDALGFIEPFFQKNINLKQKKIAVLGTGGASKAVIAGLRHAGVECLDIYSRTKIDRSKDGLTYKIYDNFDYDAYNLVINTTPLGMNETIEQAPIDTALLTQKNLILYDLIYNPLETKFLREGAKDALKINGLDMLIYQGLYALEHWFSKDLVQEWTYDDVYRLLVENEIIQERQS